MIYVVVHDKCMDGFTAGWIAVKKFGSNATVIPAVHSQNPFEQIPDDAEKVFLFDIAFSRELMLEAHRRFGDRLEVHDHHKSAQLALQDLPFCHFDMAYSGASLAWRRLFPGTKLPKLVAYVEDRDLWLNKLEYSNWINNVIAATPKTIKDWDRLSSELDNNQTAVMSAGAGIAAYIDNYAYEMNRYQSIQTIWEGHRTIVVNAPYYGISDLLMGLLDRNHDVELVMGWSMSTDRQYQYSLRSRRGEVDVSVLAKKYGGGGHVSAAGFKSEKLVF